MLLTLQIAFIKNLKTFKEMRKPSIGVLSLAVASAYGTAYAQADKQEKISELPNVIFIYADDLGFGDLDAMVRAMWKLQM